MRYELDQNRNNLCSNTWFDSGNYQKNITHIYSFLVTKQNILQNNSGNYQKNITHMYTQFTSNTTRKNQHKEYF